MKTTSKYLGVCTMALVALSVTSCSDTWDDHYGTINESVADKTLWEIISNDDQTSNFAKLAEATHYYRDEEHPQKDYTFKNLLDGTQLVSLWVPTNEAYTQEQWDKWMELAKTSPYTVQQQVLANSISLWRQSATGTAVDTMIMLNGKKIVFDKSAGTIGGSPLLEKNIAASNGTLHTVNPAVPFNYNIYEYLKDNANAKKNNMLVFHDFIVENDTTYFSEQASIEGNPDENGNPTYVDSVYFTSNNLFNASKRFPSNTNTDQYLTYNEGFGAALNVEDSVFVVLLPTDNAYKQAHDNLSKYYKYAPAYIDSEKGDQNNVAVRAVSNVDSLTEKSIKMDIFSPLVFNVNIQPNEAEFIGRWTLDGLLQNAAQAPYLLNTYRDTLRSDENWQKESLFQGTRINLSNGAGIVSDNWNIPAKLYKPDVNIEVGYGAVYNLSEYTNGRSTITTNSFSNELASEWVDSTGRVTHNDFYTFTPRSEASNHNIDFKLVGNDQEISESEVMSGKYDIYVVCVPNYYITSSDTIYGEVKKAKLGATINYNDGTLEPTASGKQVKDATFSTPKDEDIIYDGEKVDTILLFQDFEFPYSYKNLRQCYPTLTLTVKRTTTSSRKEGFSNIISIDRIILKSKD